MFGEKGESGGGPAGRAGAKGLAQNQFCRKHNSLKSF